jgi:hypothetical protein
MAEKLGSIRFLLWLGFVLFSLWFLVFSLAPASLLASMSFMETKGFFLRMFGIFPLSWAVLVLFALKDVERNIAIIKGIIITGALMVIAIVAYHFVESTTGWFHWVSAVVIFVYCLLIFMFKPKVE